MSETVSAETAGELVVIEAPMGHLGIRLPDGSILPLHGQRMRVLERNERGWRVRPEPWNFGENDYPGSWWLDKSCFRSE